MTGSGLPSFSVITLNINGLRSNPGKRKALFYGLLIGRYDIVCLQETHHESLGEARKWAEEGSGAGSPWVGPCFWSHLTSQSCGVAVLFGARMPFCNIQQYALNQASAGRILRVDFSLYDVPYTVVSIYAPCVGSERNTFFPRLHSAPKGTY